MSRLLYTLLTVVIVVILAINTVCCIDNCEKISPCSCKYSDGQVVDLSSLDGKGTAKFTDVADKKGNTYSYNPCTDFSSKGCTNVALCQNNQMGYVSFGTQESATFRFSDELYIDYQATDKFNTTRTSQVKLVCTKTDVNKPLEALGETDVGSGQYKFTLSSPYCCPNDKSGGSIKSPQYIGIIVLVIGLVSRVMW